MSASVSNGTSHVKSWPNNASEYVINKAIGSGTSATVYSATCPSIGENCAIKILNLDKCENNFDNIQKEIKIMTMCDHPNVIRYYTSFVKGVELWIVMPLKLGSISYIMQSCFEKGLPEASILRIIKDVLHALVYLHEAHQVHRDIKGSNILMDKFGQASISDLGVASWTIEGGFRTQRQTLVGSPCWMAPEVIEKDKGYNEKVDIWSLGITALELASGEVPFCHLSPVQVWLQIVREPPPTLDQMLSLTNNKKREREFSKQFREFVSLCLRKDPLERPSAKALLALPIFKHLKKLKKKSILASKQKGHSQNSNIDGLDKCDPSIISSHAVVREEVIEKFLEWSSKKEDKPMTKIMKEREKRIEEIKMVAACDDDWDFILPSDEKGLKELSKKKTKKKTITQSEPIVGIKNGLEDSPQECSPKSQKGNMHAHSQITSRRSSIKMEHTSKAESSSSADSFESPASLGSDTSEGTPNEVSVHKKHSHKSQKGDHHKSNHDSELHHQGKSHENKKKVVLSSQNDDCSSVKPHHKTVFKISTNENDPDRSKKKGVVITCTTVPSSQGDSGGRSPKSKTDATHGTHTTASKRKTHSESMSEDGVEVVTGPVKKGRFTIEKK